jgi:hypothetical protein
MARCKTKSVGLFGLFDGPNPKYPRPFVPKPGNGTWSGFVHSAADGRQPKSAAPERSPLLVELLRKRHRRRGRPHGTTSARIDKAQALYEMAEKALEDDGFKGKHGRRKKTMAFVANQLGLSESECISLEYRIRRAGRRKRQQ